MQDHFNRTLFVCECTDPSHQFIVEFYDDHDEPMFNELSISIRLGYYQPWYTRILNAIGYVFKRNHGDFDCVLLNSKEAQRLIDVLEKHKGEIR